MPTPTRASSLKLILTTLSLVVWPALILLLAGDWRWPEGWIFGGWFLALCFSTIAWLYRKDPALLAERYRRPGTGGLSRRDQIIVYLVMLGFIAWIVLMPLDARRFHWTPPLPLAVKVIGGALLAASWFFLFRSLTDTSSGDNARAVASAEAAPVTSGPPTNMRSPPRYMGWRTSPYTPVETTRCPRSVWMRTSAVVRIIEEESLLAAELPGYDDYRGRVHYRFIPFVW